MRFSDVLLGLATGVPVMIVVGPIALLLIEQGMKHGFSGGIPAAAGVATTDLAFSVAAAVMGAGAARILSPAQGLVHLVAFFALGALATHIWFASKRDLALARSRVGASVGGSTPVLVGDPLLAGSPGAGSGATHPAGFDGDGVDSGARPRSTAIGRAGAFFAVTAANPITIVVFASLVVSGRDGIGSAGWVVGMTLASVMVSTLFLAVGHGLGMILTEASVARLRMAGAVVIGALALWFALG